MKRIYAIYKFILLDLFCALNLIGCSGGGGSSSDSVGGSDGTPPIIYVGLTSLSDITVDNSADLIFGSLLAAKTHRGFIPNAEIEQSQIAQGEIIGVHPNAIHFPSVLKNLSTNIFFKNSEQHFPVAAVMLTRTITGVINGNCSSGTAVYELNIDEATGAYDGTLIFNHYCEDYVSISGETSIQGTFNLATSKIITITYIFEYLAVDNFFCKGEVSVTENSIILDLLMKNSVSEKVFWANNYTITFSYPPGMNVSGIYYDPDYGFVNIPNNWIVFSDFEWPLAGSWRVSEGVSPLAPHAILYPINYYLYSIEVGYEGDGDHEFKSGELIYPYSNVGDGWTRLRGGPDRYSESKGVAVDAVGNCLIAGPGFIAKYDTNGKEQWVITIKDHFCNGIAVDLNGNCYITGSKGIGEDTDIFVAKYDTNGNNLWTITLGTIYQEAGTGIAVDQNGSCYITGYTLGNLFGGETIAGYQEIFVLKYDSEGNQQWIKQLEKRPSYSQSRRGWSRIAIDLNGNSYITGGSNPYLEIGAALDDKFVAKYDADGNNQWTKTIELPTYNSERYSSYGGIAVDLSGSSYVTMGALVDPENMQSSGIMDIFIAKYDTHGNNLWTELLGTTAIQSGSGIAVDMNENCYITGGTGGNLDNLPNSGKIDIFIAKYDTNGNKQWVELLGTPYNDTGEALAVGPNGSCYITGTTEGDLYGNINGKENDAFIWKLVKP